MDKVEGGGGRCDKATQVSWGKCVSQAVQLRQFHAAEEDDDNPVKLKNGNVYRSSFIHINPFLRSYSQIVYMIGTEWG